MKHKIEEYPELRNIQYFLYISGKTGGSTLLKTLQDDDHSAYHIHSGLDFENKVNEQFGKIPSFTLNELIDYTIINNNNKNRTTYIIDSYREPIERAISSFFQNLTIHLPDYKEHTVDYIIDFFNKNQFYGLDSYHSYHLCFNYLKMSKDINFDFDKGYYRKDIDGVSLIKLRLKDIKKWDMILSEIIGLDIVISSNNMAKDKEYAKVYKEFKKEYKVPSPFLKWLRMDNIASQEMKKMMSVDEIDVYFEKWYAKST